MAPFAAALHRPTPTPPDDPPLSDEELVDRLRAGDETAFRVLVARHRPWLVRLGTRLLGNDAHAAEDLAQESLLKLHAAARRDQRPLRVRPWLAVVARNASVDEHRRRRPELPGELPEAPTTGEDIFMLDPALAQAWSALGGRHREVIYLRELMGMSYREIATVMELGNAAVETLLFRARAALRREYERAGGARFGCGALGLGLYRLATGEGRGVAGDHVAGCESCQHAVDALRGCAPLPAPGPAPSSIPGRRCPSLPSSPTAADLSGVSPSVWTSLSNGEPLLAKLFSGGAAIAAAMIPAVITGSLTTTPDRPVARAVASAPVQAAGTAPVGGMPGTAVAAHVALSRAVNVTVAHPPVPTHAAMPPAQEPGGTPATYVPSPDRSGLAAGGGGDRLARPRLGAGELGAAPRPQRSLPEALPTRRPIGDDLRLADELGAAGVRQPEPVQDGTVPGRLTWILRRLAPAVPVLQPAVPAPVARTGDESEPMGEAPNPPEPPPAAIPAPEESRPTLTPASDATAAAVGIQGGPEVDRTDSLTTIRTGRWRWRPT